MGPIKMVKWLADNAPNLGRRLAMLRHNEHTEIEYRWEPWHTEQLCEMLKLLNTEVPLGM